MCLVRAKVSFLCHMDGLGLIIFLKMIFFISLRLINLVDVFRGLPFTFHWCLLECLNNQYSSHGAASSL